MAGDGNGNVAALPLVGKKLMNQLGGMVNEKAACEISAFARKQMEKMGWQEGKGLGKQEQGMTSYVKVKKREELMGLGVEKQKSVETQNQWWYNAYDKIASKIKIDEDDEDDEDKKKKKKKKKLKKEAKRRDKKPTVEETNDDKRDDSIKCRVPTDEELFAATGGKLFGRRAYGSCIGKLKRDELLQAGQIPNTSMPSKKNTKKKNKDKKKRKKSKNDKPKELETESCSTQATTSSSSSSSSSSEEEKDKSKHKQNKRQRVA